MAAHLPDPDGLDPRALAVDGMYDSLSINTETLDGMKLAIFLGSALVRADELLDKMTAKTEILGSRMLFDRAALSKALNQPQLQAWLASFPPGLLPEKRGGP